MQGCQVELGRARARSADAVRRHGGAAVALALGVVGFEHALHAARGVDRLDIEHLIVDASLAVPLAFVVCLIGSRARSTAMRALTRAALFSSLLVPAAYAHHWLHGLGHGAHPGHAHSDLALAHAAGDAAAAFPVAIVIALLATPIRITRRRLALGSAFMMSVMGFPAIATGAPIITPFAAPMPIPPVLDQSDITLTAAAMDVQMLPGSATTMWTFNGTFPGPTIRRPSGTPTRVTVVNDLPAEVGPITLHHHGNHSSSEHDGQPHDHLIARGSSRTYVYELMEGGAPERGAFQWYHDHHMDVTGRNVWMGLAGMVILDDPAEAAINAQLPSGDRDVPMMVVDRSFDEDNQIPYRWDPDGTLGDVALVNGAPQPYLEVADVRYRFRILNASNARTFAFRLSDPSVPMTQVATDGGLLDAPIPRLSISLGPAERAELVIDFGGKLGQTITLTNTMSSAPGLSQVMQFRVVRDEDDDSSVPSVLRPTPSFGSTEPVVTRLWTFDRDPVDETWTINGRPFDPDRVDAQPKLGTVERWVFTNTTSFVHMVHIHDVDWRIESRARRDGTALRTAFSQPGLRETFVVFPHEVVTVLSRFTDHLGRYVLHCHMLEHEDRAMMAQFEVVP